jgi:hypothetical protein
MILCNFNEFSAGPNFVKFYVSEPVRYTGTPSKKHHLVTDRQNFPNHFQLILNVKVSYYEAVTQIYFGN